MTERRIPVEKGIPVPNWRRPGWPGDVQMAAIRDLIESNGALTNVAARALLADRDAWNAKAVQQAEENDRLRCELALFDKCRTPNNLS